MESSCAILLKVRGHIPHMYAFLLKYFFSVIWRMKFDKFNFTVNVHNICCWYRPLHLLQFYALALFEIMLRMCFRYNT